MLVGSGLLAPGHRAIVGRQVIRGSQAGNMDVQARPTYRIETFGGLRVVGGAAPLTGAATQRTPPVDPRSTMGS